MFLGILVVKSQPSQLLQAGFSLGGLSQEDPQGAVEIFSLRAVHTEAKSVVGRALST